MNITAQITLYRFYTSAFGRTIRLFILFSLVLWLQEIFTYSRSPNLFLFVMNNFFMLEVFFHFKMGRILPISPLAAHATDLFDSVSTTALFCVYEKETAEIIDSLLKRPQIQFILRKASITKKELVGNTLSAKELLKQSSLVATQMYGTYITTMDILVAYLLVTEAQTKLLFTKELKSEDLFNILSWARSTYREEENPKPLLVAYNGEGIGEPIISGWTPETKNYTRNFSIRAWSRRPLLVGREQDFNRLIEVLSKPTNNNVLLVGENGVGKETLVEAFAYDSNEGVIGGGLDRKKILEIMLGQLVAGAADRSDLELRLQAIVEEVTHAGNVLLYIPEFQDMVGGNSYNMTLTGALLPYLQDGSLPIIATMTPANYKKYIENSTLADAFSVISMNEPDAVTALHMLFEKTALIESLNRVTISYKAVVAAVNHATRYLPDSQLPGSAVQLLEDTAHRIGSQRSKEAVVYAKDVLEEISSKTHVAVGAPKQQEKELLLHLEEFLHERIVGQDGAVVSLARALRRLRSDMSSRSKPTSFLFLGPTGVGKTETAKALAEAYYEGEENMLRFDMSEYVGVSGVIRLLGALPGQGDERGELTERIHDNPSSLVLLDEFEKADPQVLNLFLQVFDDGRLTDNKGKTVSFSDTIIIATSNAGSEFIREQLMRDGILENTFKQTLLDYLQKENIFKSELLNRFDDVVVFTPLSQKDTIYIVGLLITELVNKLESEDIHMVVDEKVIQKIARDGASSDFGARPLRRYIQDTIEDRIAKMRLQDILTRGSTVMFSVDQNNELTQAIVPYSLPQS